MPAEEILLDVRDLVPPQPYELATAVLQDLKSGQYVRMISRRRPRLLYPWLTARDYCESTRQLGEEHYEIYIWAKTDEEAKTAIVSVDQQDHDSG